MDTKRIVITGGGGFLGSNMLKFLKEKGHFVRAADKSFKKDRSQLYAYADEVMSVDLRDYRSMALTVDTMDYVIHFASDMGGVGYFTNNDYTPFLNNMEMDMNLLRVCGNTKKRIYYAASACLYPINLQMSEGYAPQLEENLMNYAAEADQMYGWEKLMMTKLSERSKLDIRVGIQHTIFGPYQEIEGERMKFPTAIATKALNSKKTGEPIEIWGNGKQIRTFTYIDDCLEKIYEVVTAKDYHGAVNIGSEENVTVDEVATICCAILGIPPTFQHVPAKPSGVLGRGCSNKKYETYYKYKNKYNVKQGFTKLIDWIQHETH